MAFDLTALDLPALDLRALDWTVADPGTLDLAAGSDPAPPKAKSPANLRWRRRTAQENAAAS
jgi:hypothetical protein